MATISGNVVSLPGANGEIKFNINDEVLERHLKCLANGAMGIYDSTGTLLRTLSPEQIIIFSRHLPINPFTGVAELTTDVWEEPIFLAPTLPQNSSYAVVDAGVIPDYKASSIFGQAINTFSLGVINKGTSGSGVTAVSAVKTFDSAATVCDAVSFGIISSPNVAAGEVLTIAKVKVGNGMICPACTFYLVLNKLY